MTDPAQAGTGPERATDPARGDGVQRWLITGLSGTVAPHLARLARAAGITVLGWDRASVDPEDLATGDAWLARQAPLHAIAHLANGTEGWAARLARHAAAQRLPFVYTSSAMVFHHQPDGPHHPGDERTAQDDYGRYKIACEDAVRAAHPAACIARLGWQIDPGRADGNQMCAALDAQQARDGRIAASRAWRPACSVVGDTAAALAALLHTRRSGVVHLDSNAAEGHAFDAILHALARDAGRPHWRVLAEDDGYRHDQRLAGDEALMPLLSQRLPSLQSSAAAG
jgi:dTDP-4-dehydrorhamnose reductase